VLAEPAVPRHPALTLPMILSTTPFLEGFRIVEYLGYVSGHAIVGANAAADFMAGFTGFLGGRSTAYEKKLRKAEDAAMSEIAAEAQERGANAVVGIHVDFEPLLLKDKDAMLCMAASGTAVKVEAIGATREPVAGEAASTTTTKQNWDRLSPMVDPGRANRS
jgi:uncharacterized protein YbjQ (UPF0145 family)